LPILQLHSGGFGEFVEVLYKLMTKSEVLTDALSPVEQEIDLNKIACNIDEVINAAMSLLDVWLVILEKLFPQKSINLSIY